MPIDPRMVKWEAPPKIDPRMVRWENVSDEPSQQLKIGKDGFSDALKQTLDENPIGAQYASFGTSLSNLWEGAKQFVGNEDNQQLEANRIMRDYAPASAIAGDVALAASPFGMTGTGVKGAAAVGTAYGALQPVENAATASDVAKGKATNAIISGVASAGGQLLANKLLGSTSKKMGEVAQKVKDKAAQVAEAETLSARSAAGRAAQDAYKQLEHLRELNAFRSLTPEEAFTAHQLEKELAEKAADKLMPAAALKQSTADAYVDAMNTEQARAAQYAAEKLSTGEVKQQVMARLKRYGPAAVGGIIGNALMPGAGGAVGGAATGLVLRPAIRSMANLSKNPAVQYRALSGLNSALTATAPLFPAAPMLSIYGLLGQ